MAFFFLRSHDGIPFFLPDGWFFLGLSFAEWKCEGNLTVSLGSMGYATGWLWGFFRGWQTTRWQHIYQATKWGICWSDRWNGRRFRTIGYLCTFYAVAKSRKQHPPSGNHDNLTWQRTKSSPVNWGCKTGLAWDPWFQQFQLNLVNEKHHDEPLENLGTLCLDKAQSWCLQIKELSRNGNPTVGRFMRESLLVVIHPELVIFFMFWPPRC